MSRRRSWLSTSLAAGLLAPASGPAKEVTRQEGEDDVGRYRFPCHLFLWIASEGLRPVTLSRAHHREEARRDWRVRDTMMGTVSAAD
jgi:hypothetical protein